MSRIKLNDDGKVLYGYLNFLQFFIGTPNDIVGPYVPFIDIEEAMAIFDGLLKELLFHE